MPKGRIITLRVYYSLNFDAHKDGNFSTPGFNNRPHVNISIYWSKVPMHTQCTPPQRLAPTFRDDRNPRARTWVRSFSQVGFAKGRTLDGHNNQQIRINPKDQGGQQCRALFSTMDQRTDGPVDRSS